MEAGEPGEESTAVEAVVSQIRIHELADQLEVDPQQIVSCLLEQGMEVRGPSAVLAESTAARVRRALRGRSASSVPTPRHPPGLTVEPKSRTDFASVSQDAHSPVFAFGDASNRSTDAPMFLTPTTPTPPTPPTSLPAAARPLIPAPRSSGDVRAWSDTTGQSSAATTEAEPEPDNDRRWRQRGLDPDEQEAWRQAGLRATESGLADQCRAADIEPADLGTRLSGRTALQRLRDGESVMSIWARLQEARQQQPRSGTRLSGRFQQQR